MVNQNLRKLPETVQNQYLWATFHRASQILSTSKTNRGKQKTREEVRHWSALSVYQRYYFNLTLNNIIHVFRKILFKSRGDLSQELIISLSLAVAGENSCCWLINQTDLGDFEKKNVYLIFKFSSYFFSYYNRKPPTPSEFFCLFICGPHLNRLKDKSRSP